MVSHHPGKFGGHKHCGKGDIMFLEVEEQDSKYPLLNPSLLFMSKGHGLKAHDILC